jgi:ribonuclease R
MSAVPDEGAVLGFLRSSSAPVGWQQLIRKFVEGGDPNDFKRLVKRLVSEGKMRKIKGRRYILTDGETPERSGKSKAQDGVREDSLRARIIREGHFLFAVSGEGRDKVKFVLPKAFQGHAKPGQSVLIKPLDRKGPFGYPAAKVLTGVRHTATFSEVSQAFLKDMGLPQGYPKAAMREAEQSPEPVWMGDKRRMDLRAQYIVTIDPADAKDHDDAISLEKLSNGNWKLGVHIADVSEYVSLDGALDEEALRRSFTQYLPWTAVPMLPQRLSGDLCSLLEGRERLAFSCLMEVDDAGKLVKFDFNETFIKVARFYSYEEAQALKDSGDPFLKQLSDFTDLLLRRRREDGYLEFQFPEPKVQLDADRQPVDIRPVERVSSYGWIEECMLLANQAAAMYLHRYKLPGLFRVHEQPDLEVVAELWTSQTALSKGHDVRAEFSTLRETHDYLNSDVQHFYIRLLDPSRGALPPSVQRRILQSMKKAQYDPRPLGHFALGWLYYSHFTSPIRRYADLWTHRVMKAYLHGEKPARSLRTRAVAVAGQVSEREISVMKVERKAMRVATAWIFQAHVGKEFIGEISGVEGFGLFVTVSNPYGEGLIPVARMRDDFYEHDLETKRLIGRRHGRTFELGLRVKVRVARSDPFSGQVDFDFLGRA